MGADDPLRKARDTTRRAVRTAGAAARAAGSAARPVVHTGSSAAQRLVRAVHRITRASGAGRTGLADLLELTAVSSAGDAFIAVALAGTLFFHASLEAARSQVMLYLLVTMAPFAVLAPLIGPMLDRMRQGRRYILAGTMLGRGLLCWGMAGAITHSDPLTLLPSAFAVLVLSKAYGITRSAVTPRLLPAEITLVTANARCSLASLIAAAVAAPVAAGVSGVVHAGWVLRMGSVIFLVGSAASLRLPGRVDTASTVTPFPPAAGHPATGSPGGQGTGAPSARDAAAAREAAANDAAAPGVAAPGHRMADGRPTTAGRRVADSGRWRTLGHVGPVVGEAMRANAAIRAFSGFLIMFLAFLLRSHGGHFRGVNQNVALGALVIAAAVGGLAGTAIGSALRSRLPHLIMFGTIAGSALVTAACAAFFGLVAALMVAFAAAFAQSLAKLALDSIVQREIGEEIRSSTFAVSETLHQISWVAGGLIGVLLSITANGTVGLSIAAAGLGAALVGLIAGRRRRKRPAGRIGPGLARSAADGPPAGPGRAP